MQTKSQVRAELYIKSSAGTCVIRVNSWSFTHVFFGPCRRQVFWMSKQILQLMMEDAIDDWLMRQIHWLREGGYYCFGNLLA